MKDSGIRFFCTHRCAGACCFQCKSRCVDGCKQKPRNIVCSVTICRLLHSVWRDNVEHSYLSERDFINYKQVAKYILDKVDKIKEDAGVEFDITTPSSILRAPFPLDHDKPVFNERILNKLPRIKARELRVKLEGSFSLCPL